MKEDKTARIVASSGKAEGENLGDIEKLFICHNFVNRLDIILRKDDLETFKQSITDLNNVKKFVFESSLNQLLNMILKMTAEERKSVKMVTIDKDMTHENSICISQGKLTLKIRSDLYLKSGFQFQLSSFSRGNKRFNTQMYIHTFDLVNLEENVKKNCKNDTRLIWFAQNIMTETFNFVLTTENANGSGDFRNFLVEENGGVVKSEELVHFNTNTIEKCLVPDLDFARDDDQCLQETLEWLNYAAVRGRQLTQKVDPFISRFPITTEFIGKIDLVIMSIDRCLIPSVAHVKIFNALLKSVPWFSMLSYGVKNCTRSYSNSGEHYFTDDGTNDIAILVQNKHCVVWQTTDSGDPHF